MLKTTLADSFGTGNNSIVNLLSAVKVYPGAAAHYFCTLVLPTCGCKQELCCDWVVHEWNRLDSHTVSSSNIIDVFNKRSGKFLDTEVRWC